jgi:hypothetical protein
MKGWYDQLECQLFEAEYLADCPYLNLFSSITKSDFLHTFLSTKKARPEKDRPGKTSDYEEIELDARLTLAKLK